MRHGSLFSGIGGFDLAAKWMGWENVFHCEINEFGRKVLHYHFPNSISYEDITKTDFTIHRGHIDVLSGGFPCQPFSSAGSRRGTEDTRHLWPQMLRAIKEIAPSWIVGENVYGLVNWSNGMVFHEIQADLEAQGYEVFPILCPAVSVNAPHVRQRIFFIAHSRKLRLEFSEASGTMGKGQAEICGERSELTLQSSPTSEAWTPSDSELNSKRPDNRADGEETGAIRGNEESNVLGTLCGDGITSNSNDTRTEFGMRSEREWKESDGIGGLAQSELGQTGRDGITSDSNGRRQSGQEYRKETSGWSAKKSVPDDWRNFPTISPICVRNDGVSYGLDSITFPKWRNESIKAAGNAVVPQLVLQFFKTIAEYERIATSDKNQKEA